MNHTDQKKDNDNFLVQGGILAVASILVRFIGMIYRVPMTNIIGDEGNTCYSNAYEFYNIMLLLSSYSLPVAISKLVSAKASLGQWKNIHAIVRSAILFGLVTGTVFTLLAFFGADWYFTHITINPSSAIALRVMSPSIFVMALLGVFRGFFQGMKSMIPTAVSQILEQITHAITSVLAAWILFGYGERVDLVKGTDTYAPAWGAAGGTLGTLMGALVALLFFLVLFQAYRKYLKKRMKRDKTETVDSTGAITKLIVTTAVPVIISTTAYNIINLLDSSLFSHYMASIGKSSVYQTTWGAYMGKYMLLINVPVAFASAMSSSLVPSLTEAFVKNNRSMMIRKVNTALRVTMLIAIPCAVGLTVLANPIIELLFTGESSDAAMYLTIGSLTVVVFSLSTITNGILQGINKMKVPVRHSLMSLAVHLVLMYFFVWQFNMGIYGVIISYIAFGVCMCTMNSFSIGKYLNYQQQASSIYILPAISALVMGVACFFVHKGITLIIPGGVGNLIGVVLAILIGIGVYFVMMVLTKGLNRDTMADLPMGGKMIRLAVKLHLMK